MAPSPLPQRPLTVPPSPAHSSPTPVSLTNQTFTRMTNDEKPKTIWSVIFKIIQLAAAALAGYFGGTAAM